MSTNATARSAVELFHAYEAGLLLRHGCKHDIVLGSNSRTDKRRRRREHRCRRGRGIRARPDDALPFSARGAAGGLLKGGDRCKVVERRDKDEGTARATGDHADRVRRVIDRHPLQANFPHHRRNRVGPLLFVARWGYDRAQPHEHRGGRITVIIHILQRRRDAGIRECRGERTRLRKDRHRQPQHRAHEEASKRSHLLVYLPRFAICQRCGAT
jgi:hypothetical protein